MKFNIDRDTYSQLQKYPKASKWSVWALTKCIYIKNVKMIWSP